MGLGLNRAVAKAKNGEPHRFSDLVVNEVSLVTEPAILSQQESDDGVGFPVVKSVDEVHIPDAVAKAITPRDGEDYMSAIQRCINACKLKAMVELNDGDLYWMDAVKIGADSVILADYWGDPFSDSYVSYKCTYTQNESGDFEVTGIEKLKIKWVLADEPAEDAKEDDVPDTTKAAEAPAAPAVVTEEAPPVAVAPVAAEPVEAAKSGEVTKNLSNLFSVEHMLQLSQGTGKTYRAIVTTNGVTYEPVETVVVAPEAPIAKAAEVVPVEVAPVVAAPVVDEALVAKVAALEAENLQLKQRLIPTVDPAVAAAAAEAAVSTETKKNYAPGLAPNAGIFTTGLFR